MDRKVNSRNDHLVTYKQKDVITDKRALRAHRRSVDQKQLRNDRFQKLRNMSPVKEEKSVPVSKASKSGDALKDRLKKWKEERDLKTKLEAKQKGKKGTFKVSHLTHNDNILFKKETVDKKKPKTTSTAKVTAPAPVASRVTRKSTRIASQGDDKPKLPPTKTTKAATAKQAPVKKAASKSVPAVSRRPTRQQSTKPPVPAAKVGAKKVVEAAPKRKASSRSTTVSKAAATKSSESESSTSADEVFNIDEKKINKKRGRSFAPDDFKFSAPSNLTSFSFKPLSPASAASFMFGDQDGGSYIASPLARRCSTPKASTGKVQHSPVVAMATASPSELTSSASESEAAITKKTPSKSQRRKSTRSNKGSQSSEDDTLVQQKTKTPKSTKKTPKSIKKTKNNAEAIQEISKIEPVNESGHQGESSDETKWYTAVKSPDVSKKSLRRSLRPAPATDSESQSTASSADEQCSVVQKPQEKVANRRRSTRRKSTATSDDTDSQQSTDDESEKRGRRNTRRSCINVLQPVVESMETENVSPVKEPALDKIVEDQKTTKENMDFKELGTPKPKDPTEGVKSSDESTFRTPGLSARKVLKARSSGRRRTTPIMPSSGRRLLAKAKSPEESVTVLSRSPMIEMSRKTPKIKPATPPANRSFVEPLNFDDMDDIIDADPTNEHNEPTTSPDTIKEKTDEELLKGEHNVPYFRALVRSETKQFNISCGHWEKILSETSGISEEVQGQIRTTIGQAKLLVAQRFKQFVGLIDNSEFNTGEKEITATDLQGFWDMIYFQVEDVNKKFEDLAKLRANNWVEETPKPKVVAVKKKTVKPAVKKAAAKPVVKKAGGGFAAFRAKMKEQQKQKEKKEEAPEENITFDAGFFKVSSPVRNPKVHCSGGSPGKVPTKRLSSSLLTPNNSPLMKQVLLKSARKSMGATPGLRVPGGSSRKSTPINAIISASHRPSPLLRDTTPHNSPVPLSSSVFSPLREQSERTDSTGSTGFSPGPTAPIFTPESQGQAGSIFTPDSLNVAPTVENVVPMETENNTPATRKSSRKSNATTSDQCSILEESSSSDPFAKYLKPSSPQINEEHMDVDTGGNTADIEQDEEMPAQMKKNLTSIFDDQVSAKKIKHNSGPLPKKTPASLSCRTRRSVHFMSSKLSPERDQDEIATRLPLTPFNRSSLVKEKRRSRLDSGSSLGKSGMDSHLLFTPEAESKPKVNPDTVSPATRFANLRVGHTPAPSSTKNLGSLLFTPPPPSNEASLLFTPMPQSETNTENTNLMCFSPLEEPSAAQIRNQQDQISSPLRRSSRKSRVSLL
ncbi:unnamed protein product [Owenia fusiformis]|uniref:Disks large-associated protein 5 n=1 Tax=Owenia fusiformis TaxID=6347 RepID=A0A8S4N3Q3_OWEFU|nr:unnamed protein product [Owenia fusiformis]